jgi:carbon storage regulator
MLYLTRKIGQSIVINDKIEVMIVEIKGKTVKIGIEFPKNVTVLRKEVYDNVVEQNIEASKTTLDESFFESLVNQINSKPEENNDKS